MKIKIFAGAAFASLLAGSALAADLPSRKSAPVYVAPAPIMTWNGFYVGLNAGYAWGAQKFNAAPGASWIGDPDAPGIAAIGNRSMNLAGGTVGGTIGYNRQFGQLLAGLELDGGWMGLKDPVLVGPFPGVGGGSYGALYSASSSYLATFRGRLGFLVTPTLLAYVTGGAALSDVQASQSIAYQYTAPVGCIVNCIALPNTGAAGGANSGLLSGGRLGWMLGGGLEWMFAQNWSAKVEYLYADFGKQNVVSAYVAPNGSVWTANHQFSRSVNVVRAGLNYHFNSYAAPVVAKY